jgi:hypothetical protein
MQMVKLLFWYAKNLKYLSFLSPPGLTGMQLIVPGSIYSRLQSTTSVRS